MYLITYNKHHILAMRSVVEAFVVYFLKNFKKFIHIVVYPYDNVTDCGLQLTVSTQNFKKLYCILLAQERIKITNLKSSFY